MSDAAHRVYVDALSFCGDMPEPNGYLSDESANSFVKSRGKRVTVLDELVDLNAWEKINGGFLIHDFENYLPKTSRDRTKAWRDRKREEAARLSDVPVTSRPRHGDVTANTRVTSPSGHAASPPRARATGLETISTPAVTPEPVPEPVPVLHGDAVVHERPNGASTHPWATVSRATLIGHVGGWFLNFKQWHDVKPQTRVDLEADATAMVDIGIPGDQLHAILTELATRRDPDDVNRLSYFWQPVQDEAHARIKQQRGSHVRTDDELTKVKPDAPSRGAK